MIYRRKRNFVFRFFAALFRSQFFISLLGLAILAGIVYPWSKNYLKKREVEKEIAKLKQEIEEIEGKNDSLKKAIDYLNSDQFVEEQARLKLGLKKAGENVIVIKDDSLSAAGDGSANNSIFETNKVREQKPPGNPEKWFAYFFSKK